MTRLGGTCGIPRYDRRVYVKVACAVDSAGVVQPTEIDWDGTRRFPVLSRGAQQEWGRWENGSVVRGWRVEVAAGVWRTLWWERGRFFVERRDTNGE